MKETIPRASNSACPPLTDVSLPINPTATSGKRKASVDLFSADERDLSDTEESLSESDDSISTEDEEQETQIARQLVKAAFDRTLSEQELRALINKDILARGKRRRFLASSSTGTIVSNTIDARMRLTQSVPALTALCDMTINVNAGGDVAPSMKPDDFLRYLLKANGKQFQSFQALSLLEFFQPVTQESIDSYDLEIIKAVREEDIDTLRRLHSQGRSLQCANRFGESIVHIACRRGSFRVLKFLVEQAGVSCRVCCDFGRTSLHDACWTSTPNFKLIGFLLDLCPDLLYLTDKRGSTPLSYVRQQNYHEWCSFLAARGIDSLLPRELQ